MAFEKSTKKLQTMTALEEMRAALQTLGPIPSDMRIYDYAVHFFNIIAQFQDKYSVTESMFKDSKETASLLAQHLSNSGRCEYGWVRAKKGQPVTLDNLYLGDVAGIWTFPASKFKAMPEDKYVQTHIQGQLRGFIKSHREPIMDLISKTLKTEKKPNGFFFRLFGNSAKTK